MTFYEWMIVRYLKRDTARGDLAKDMEHDADFPRDAGYDELLAHLRHHHACKECIALFKRCWKDYSKAVASEA